MQLENTAPRTHDRGAVERICEVDGVTFFTTPAKVARGQARWCSKRCFGTTLSTSVEVACLVCGKVRQVSPSRIAKGGGKFCEKRACRDIGLRKTVIRICPIGNHEFEVMAYEADRIFCNRAHSLASRKGIPRTEEAKRHMSEARTGVPRPHLRLPTVEFTCVGCGRTEMLTGYQRKRFLMGLKRFHDTECWYAYVREHPEASGTFRGGRMPYYGPNWRDQARRARARDGYTCQDCGEKPKQRLDVHHLVPRRTFHEDFIAANALDNLISLCKRCHRLREVEFDGMFCPDLRPGAPGYIRRGVQQANARLTEELVREIRVLAAAGVAQKTIAASMDVCVSTVSHVLTRRTWQHVV